MSEPALDLSEIMDLYKEDARKSVDQMRAALTQWKQVPGDEGACLQLRKLAHQLRGSGRTYGFRNVTRVAKALENVMIKVQSKRLPTDDRVQRLVNDRIERLAAIFG